MCAHFGGGERNSCEQMKTWLICIVQRTGTYRHSQWWSKPEASSVRADARQVPDLWSWSVTGICRLLQTWGIFWWLVPRVGCSQSDINCQFLQQLTTPPNHLATMADGASWPKGARWAFWTLDSTSWIQLGQLHSVHMEGRGHIRMWGFPSLGSIPNAPWKGAVPAIQYNCGGRCRILLPGQGRGGEAEWKGSLLTLNIRVFPECCQTQHLHWHVF